MKLLTVNVHAWLEEKQLEKIDYLAETIADQQYDVIALQEVNQTIEAEVVQREIKADNYGLILMDKLTQLGIGDYQYIWSPSHIGYDRYDEGIAILTRLTVLEKDTFFSSKSETMHSILSRKIVGVRVQYKDEEIDIYSCHINLPDALEENQLENIERILKRKQDGKRKILLGDFNTDAISNPQAYEAILNLGLWDTYQLAKEKDEGITVEKNIDGWQDHESKKRLDYILTDQPVEVLWNQVIFNGRNGQVISDHFGVHVELEL